MHPIDKAEKDKRDLAASYCVPVSSIVWIGDNKYIIVTNGEQIKV